MTSKLRIGFVDYRLEIAHAGMLLHRLRTRAESAQCEVVACTAMEGESGRQWAEANSVPYFESVADLKGKVDGILIPAATNPEHHLSLFRQSAELGVPVFVDKPFAPDAATGYEIFKLAKEKGVPVFSTSALRYSDEVTELRARFTEPCFVQTWGGWSTKFDEFLIHPIESAMVAMGPGLLAVRRESRGELHRIELIYPEGRRCSVHFSPAQQPYEIVVGDPSGWEHRTIKSPFFERLLDHVVDVFRGGKVPVSPLETLSVLKAMDACRASTNGCEVALSWSAEELQLVENFV